MMKPHSPHIGDKSVRVGPYEVFPGGTMWFKDNYDHVDEADLPVPLTDRDLPFAFGEVCELLWVPLLDFGGAPENWKEVLTDMVIPLLEKGRQLMPFCTAGHGRTGLFLASLIALLESAEETPDPIKAVRERHCKHAVETLAQAKAIFALRGEELPKKYQKIGKRSH